MAASGIRVRGLADVQRALRGAERDVRLGIRSELRSVAEPVRADAEQLAVSEIRRIGVPWSRMRTGVTTNSVFVAPKQRGVKGRDGRRRRPNLAGLLMGRAMQPALDRNAPKIEREFNEMLHRVARDFNRKGGI